MSAKDKEAFEAVKKAFTDNHAWFQTMLSNKMDGHIAEHFWQAALAYAKDTYAPKVTEKEAVEIAFNASVGKWTPFGKDTAEGWNTYMGEIITALRTAGVRFRDEPNPVPGACQ